MTGFWTRPVEFRGRMVNLCRDGDGNWWLDDETGNEIVDITSAEMDYWAQYVCDWRADP